MPLKWRATRARVTCFTSSGYQAGSRAMRPTFAVSPLSPERAWASQRSWILGIEYVHPYVGFDLGPVDERRPVGHHFLYLRAAAGEAGNARRPGEDQRGDLPGEALHRRPVLSADPDPQLHLRCLGIRRPGERSMGGVDPDELGEDLLELEPQVLEPLAENAVGGAGLVVGLGPAVHQGTDRLVAVEVRDRDLELVGAGPAPDAAHPDPVLP